MSRSRATFCICKICAFLFLFVFTTLLHSGILYGPVSFERTSGAPDEYMVTFNAPAEEVVCTIIVINGSAEENDRISVASIFINGIEIFRERDFNRRVSELVRTVTLSGETSLFVKLRSGPSGFLTVSVNIPCILSSEIEVSSVNYCDGTVHFEADYTEYLGEEVTLYWDFDGDGHFDIIDGSLSESFTYEPGLYNAILKVSDRFGCEHFSDVQVEPKIILPVAAFYVDSSLKVDDTIHFMDLSQPGEGAYIEGWNWNFGDGNTSTDPDPDYIYSNPGFVEINLNVTNNYGCEDDTSIIIEVLEKNFLKVVSMLPEYGCTAFVSDENIIMVKFSDLIGSGIVPSNFVIQDLSDLTLGFSFSMEYSETETTVALTDISPQLRDDRIYVFRIHDDLRDLSGRRLDGENFCVSPSGNDVEGGDFEIMICGKEPPRITKFIPSYGALPAENKVTIHFSKPLALETVTSSNIGLAHTSSPTINHSFTLSTSDNNTIVYLDSIEPELTSGIVYDLYIFDGIRGMGGLALDGEYEALPTGDGIEGGDCHHVFGSVTPRIVILQTYSFSKFDIDNKYENTIGYFVKYFYNNWTKSGVDFIAYERDNFNYLVFEGIIMAFGTTLQDPTYYTRRGNVDFVYDWVEYRTCATFRIQADYETVRPSGYMEPRPQMYAIAKSEDNTITEKLGFWYIGDISYKLMGTNTHWHYLNMICYSCSSCTVINTSQSAREHYLLKDMSLSFSDPRNIPPYEKVSIGGYTENHSGPDGYFINVHGASGWLTAYSTRYPYGRNTGYGPGTAISLFDPVCVEANFIYRDERSPEYGARTGEWQPVTNFFVTDGMDVACFKLPATSPGGDIDAKGQTNFPDEAVYKRIIDESLRGMVRKRGGYTDFIIGIGSRLHEGYYKTGWHNFPDNLPVSNIKPKVIELGNPFPNPFNHNIGLDFSIKEKLFISVTVFDILGKSIKVLTSGEYQPGEYQVTWNGNDAQGNQCESGIYLIRFSSKDVVAVKKMVLIK